MKAEAHNILYWLHAFKSNVQSPPMIVLNNSAWICQDQGAHSILLFDKYTYLPQISTYSY